MPSLQVFLFTFSFWFHQRVSRQNTKHMKLELCDRLWVWVWVEADGAHQHWSLRSSSPHFILSPTAASNATETFDALIHLTWTPCTDSTNLSLFHSPQCRARFPTAGGTVPGSYGGPGGGVRCACTCCDQAYACSVQPRRDQGPCQKTPQKVLLVALSLGGRKRKKQPTTCVDYGFHSSGVMQCFHGHFMYSSSISRLRFFHAASAWKAIFLGWSISKWDLIHRGIWQKKKKRRKK